MEKLFLSLFLWYLIQSADMKTKHDTNIKYKMDKKIYFKKLIRKTNFRNTKYNNTITKDKRTWHHTKWATGCDTAEKKTVHPADWHEFQRKRFAINRRCQYKYDMCVLGIKCCVRVFFRIYICIFFWYMYPIGCFFSE